MVYTKINDPIKKLFYKNNMYNIIGIIDLPDDIINIDLIEEYINNLFIQNELLHKYFFIEGDNLYSEKISNINIKDYYDIIHLDDKKDDIISNIINWNLDTKLRWRFFLCIDKDNTKTLYFLIDHVYGNGYDIINMLTTCSEIEGNHTLFKRETTILNTLYYCTIGFIVLFISNIKIFIDLLLKKKQQPNENMIDFINCGSYELLEIKKFTKENNITITSFLYFLMLKAHFLYTNKSIIYSNTSVLNTKKNNIVPYFTKMNMNIKDSELLYDINNSFNILKYSFFIPITSFSIENVFYLQDIDTITNNNNKIMDNIDCSFSSVIVKNKYKFIKNLSFIIKPNNNEVYYNMLSYNNFININCSFKSNIISDKQFFKECINTAYNDILKKSG